MDFLGLAVPAIENEVTGLWTVPPMEMTVLSFYLLAHGLSNICSTWLDNGRTGRWLLLPTARSC